MSKASDQRRFSSVDKTCPPESELKATLNNIAARTRVARIAAPLDVMLDPSNKTGLGFTLSRLAVRQICGLLCRGLSVALMDLAGFGGKSSSEEFLHLDKDEVRRFYNEVVKKRFAVRLRNKRFIIDTQLKRVDGVVGSKYRPLSNKEFYHQISTRLLSSKFADLQATFHDAILSGRTMVLRFRQRVPLFSIGEGEDKDSYYQGWQFVNSETGKTSIHGSLVVIRRKDDGKASGPLLGCGRVFHVESKKFSKKVTNLILKVLKQRADASHWKSRIVSLSSDSLGLGGLPEAHDRAVEKIIKLLHRRRRLPLWLAKQVVNSMVQAAVENARSSNRYGLESYEAMGRITAYDLLVASMRVASRQPVIDDEFSGSRFAHDLVLRGFEI